MAATDEFRESRLRELVGVQVGGLLHEPQALDSALGADAPSDSQPWESDLRKAVDLNDVTGAVEGLESRNGAAAETQARVNGVFDDRDLIARGDFETASALGDRERCSRGIVK